MSNWNPKANEIFARAIEIADADQQVAYCDQACGDDNTLRTRVRQMLVFHEQAGDFLQSPAHETTLSPEIPIGHAPTLPLDSAPPDPSNPSLENTLISSGDTGHDPRLRNDEPPRKFGDYELLSEIACGGMGIVYKARQTTLNRIVAIKMILTGQLASEQEVRRFHAEAEAAAGLEHVGIVPVFEVGEYAGQHFFSMGYVAGGSLSDRLKDGPLPPEEAAKFTKQIAEAVAFAHSKGVIHRDLKPANVLLDAENQPRITDFGLARFIESDSGLTATGQILGTPGFMSPEQAQGDNTNVDRATDIYAVGAILFNLLTGRPPFQGASPIETVKQVIESEPVSPRRLNPGTDRDLETICLKCLEKNAHRRYLSAQDLADELGRHLSGEPIHARPISTSARCWRWCRRNPIVAGLAGTAVIFLIAGTVISTIFAYHANQNAILANDNYATSERQGKRADRNAERAKAREDEARDLLQQVREQNETSRHKLYCANMNLCGLSAESDGGVSLIQQCLANSLPVDGQTDLRGWEWRLFDSHIHRAARTINLGPQGFALDWSPDGEQLAIGGSRGIVILDRLGKRVAELHGHEHFVRSVKWDPAGKQLASGCQLGTLLLWDDPLHSDEYRQLPCVAETILSLDWSHDGAVLAALFEGSRRVEIWQPDTEHPTAVLTGTGRQLCFSPVDHRLACGDGDNVCIWKVSDPHNPKRIATLGDNGSRVKGLSWSPSGKQLAVGLINGEIKLHTLSPERVETLRGHTGTVYQTAWSDTDARFISAGFDYTVRIWDTEYLDEVEVLRGHTDRVFGAQYHPDATMIASTGEDRTVRFWTPDNACIRDVTGDTHGLTPGHNDQWRVSWNPATEAIATSGNNDSIIHDSKSLTPGKTLPGPHVCWNQDGTRAAFSARDTVSIWNAETGTVEAMLMLPTDGGDGIRISSIAWDPRQDRIAIVGAIDATQAGAIFVWTVDEPSAERVLDLDVIALSATFSPDGNQLGIGGNYGNVTIWDEDTGHVTRLELPVSREAVHAVCWSPDGNRLAMGCADHSIQIRDMRTEAITALRGHTFPVWGLAWHPDEERLASAGGDSTVKIWDTTHDELITTLAIDDSARAVAWHSDGRRLAALSASQTLKIWDATELDDRESTADSLPSWWSTRTPTRNAEKLQVLRGKWEDIHSDDWFDLLPHVDLPRDQCVGEWRRTDAGLRSDLELSSRIHVMALPPNNYRLRVRFARVSGVEALAFTIPVGDAQCRIVLSGWGGDRSGLDKIDGNHVPYGNPTHTVFACETNVEYEFEAEVNCRDSEATVTAVIDGKELFTWNGATSRLSMAEYERLDYEHTLGLGTYESEFLISELMIKPSGSVDHVGNGPD